MTCTSGQVLHSSSASPAEGTSAVADVQGVEPGHTRSTGSPTHEPMVDAQRGLVESAVLLQPTVMTRPGVQVNVPLVLQPQSRAVPALAVVQVAVTPVPVPPQLVVLRTHVPAVDEQPETAVVGPVEVPIAHRPAFEHQPHPVAADAAHVEHVGRSAHGSVGGTSTGQGPQSAEHVVQFSPRDAEHVRSPQKSSTGTSVGGGHEPQSRAQLEHDSSPLQTPSPHEGPVSIRITSGCSGTSGTAGTSGTSGSTTSG